MPVEIPLDKICVRSGVLCPRCQSLVDKGLYDDIDLNVMRALISLENKLSSIKIKYIKSKIKNGKLLVFVEAEPPDAIPVWLGKELVAYLDDPSIKEILILPKFNDPQKLLEYIIKPYRVLGVKRTYLPDGSLVVTLSLPQGAREKLESSGLAGLVIEALREKYGGDVLIDYVKESSEQERISVSKQDIKNILSKLDLY
jgi:transcription antitermination factor NusA-like protein